MEPSAALLCSGACQGLLLFVDPDRNGSRFGTDIKADAATGAPLAGIGNCIIPLPVQRTTLNQNGRRTRHSAQATALAQVCSNLNLAATGIAHKALQLNRDDSQPFSYFAEIIEAIAVPLDRLIPEAHRPALILILQCIKSRHRLTAGALKNE
jgi:hypothetical protein